MAPPSRARSSLGPAASTRACQPRRGRRTGLLRLRGLLGRRADLRAAGRRPRRGHRLDGPGVPLRALQAPAGRWPAWSPCSAARSTSPAKPTGAADSSTPRSPSAATAFAKAWTRCGGTGIRCTTDSDQQLVNGRLMLVGDAATPPCSTSPRAPASRSKTRKCWEPGGQAPRWQASTGRSQRRQQIRTAGVEGAGHAHH